jgi:hypothetical protein
MDLTIELPLAFAVEDYHDFDSFGKLLHRLSPELKLLPEVAFGPESDGAGYSLYWGVIYTGRKPGKVQVYRALIQAGWMEENENSEMKELTGIRPLLIAGEKRGEYWDLIRQISEEQGVTKGEARRLYKLANATLH